MHKNLVLAENADAAAQGANDEQWADDAAVRRWVTATSGPLGARDSAPSRDRPEAVGGVRTAHTALS